MRQRTTKQQNFKNRQEMETEARESPLAIWTVTDGKAGNEAQALGLAEALARRRPAEIRRLTLSLRPFAARLPATVWHWLSRHVPGWPEAGLAAGGAALAPPWPGLCIGAGRRAAPVVAAIGRRAGIPTVQLLAPQMDLSAFSLVVAPAHDGLEGPNVLTTLGSIGRITPAEIAAAAEAWAGRLAHLPSPRIAVLLGGPGRAARWSEADVDRFCSQIASLSRDGAGLIITSSRRSDPVAVAALRRDCDPARTFLYTGEGENPYPAMLGLADAVIVTEDSVNMASEAASSGLPVHVFRVSGPSPKATAFHAALAARGIARDFEGRISHWNYTPLAEADRIAAEVEARLLGN